MFPMKYSSQDPFIWFLQKIIRAAVRAVAVLMTLVILWAVVDIIWILYQQFITEPYGLLNINDILSTFGAFMAVLIAIEIFVNIIVYLRDEVIHVKIVLATALMAIARKVIVFDYDQLSSEYVWATAAVILALSLGYWLIALKDPNNEGADERNFRL